MEAILMEENSLFKWKVYHLTQPYFFSHHHFHLRKIELLRNSGIDAKHLVFVPKKTYFRNQLKYEEIGKNEAVKIIIIPSKKLYFLCVISFIIRDLLNGNNILVHFLRSSPWPIIFLKKIPILKRKLRYIQELEGDSYSEALYSQEFDQTSANKNGIKYFLRNINILFRLLKEKIQVKSSDALILMSPEHVTLWQSRLKATINTLILPTLPDPNKVRFDKVEREIIRNDLGLHENLVISYVGNIASPWQRLDSMCAFVSRISQNIPEIKFLVLVRQDDIELMQNTIIRYKLQSSSIVINASHRDVYKYLSASDLALFLRHDHTMNKIVTSGKLDEYLSAGLPVITTGSNADFINEFILKSRAGFFIDET